MEPSICGPHSPAPLDLDEGFCWIWMYYLEDMRWGSALKNYMRAVIWELLLDMLLRIGEPIQIDDI
jgi:hypothetical protein